MNMKGKKMRDTKIINSKTNVSEEVYTLRGMHLSLADMKEIHDKYEIMCLEEYLLENYNLTNDNAWHLANEVVDYKDEIEKEGYPVTDNEAIKFVSTKLDIKLTDPETEIVR